MTQSDRPNPHPLRGILRPLDLLPYLAVIGVYPMLVFRTLGEPPNPPPGEWEQWWHEFSVNAILLYVPSMILCAALEWIARRYDRRGAELTVRLFRWAHFAIVFGPLFYFLAYALNYELQAFLRS